MSFSRKQPRNLAVTELQQLEQRLMLSADGLMALSSVDNQEKMPDSPSVATIEEQATTDFTTVAGDFSYDASGADDLFAVDEIASDTKSVSPVTDPADQSPSTASQDSSADVNTPAATATSSESTTLEVTPAEDTGSGSPAVTEVVAQSSNLIPTLSTAEAPAVLTSFSSSVTTTPDLTTESPTGPPAASPRADSFIDPVVTALNSTLSSLMSAVNQVANVFQRGISTAVDTIYAGLDYLVDQFNTLITNFRTAVESEFNKVYNFSTNLTKVGVVDALSGLGFTVTKIQDGLSDGSHAIPATTDGSLIEFAYAKVLFNGTVTTTSTSGPGSAILAGLSNFFGVDFAFTFGGNFSVNQKFKIDGAGLSVDPDSTLSMALTIGATATGNGTLGGLTSISLTGGVSGSLNIDLSYVSRATFYSVADLGNIIDVVIPVISGSYSLSLGFKLSGLTASYSLTEGFTSNFATRTTTTTKTATITATLALPGLTDAVTGAAKSLSFLGVYSSGTNSWTFTSSLASAKLYGLPINNLDFTFTVTPTTFAGTGSATFTLDMLTNGSSPIVVTLGVIFSPTSVTFTGTATAVSLKFLDSSNSPLLTLSNVNVSVTITGNYVVTTSASVTFTAADGTFKTPGGSFTTYIYDGSDADTIGLTGTYNFITKAFSGSIDQFKLEVKSVLIVTAAGVTLNYDRSKTKGNQLLASVATAQIKLTLFQVDVPSSDGSADPLTITLNNLSIFEQGITLGSASGTIGSVAVGSALQIISPTVTLSNLSLQYGKSLSGVITVSATAATLFPNGSINASITDGGDADAFALVGSYNLGTNAYSLNADQFNMSVGEALKVSASNLTFGYNPQLSASQVIASIANASAVSPLFPTLGTLTLTNLQIRQNGFDLGNATLNINNGAPVTFAGFITFNNLQLQINNFSYTYGDTSSVSGTISASASSIVVFENSSFLTSTVQNFVLSYNFAQGGKLEINIGTFTLKVGEALAITASNVTITPGTNLILTIASASVTSPMFPELIGTISNIKVYRDGIVLGSANITYTGTVTYDGFLSVTNPFITLSNFSTRGVVTGTITFGADALTLFPGSSVVTATATGITGVYDFSNGGRLSINLATFTASIASNAIEIDSTNVTIFPNAFPLDPIATIGAGTIKLNIGGVNAQAAATGVTIYRDGVTIADGNFSLPNLTFGPLSLSGVTASVSNLDTRGPTAHGIVTVTASTISLNLGSSVNATVSNLSVSIDLADSSSFTVKFDFVATIASGALKITATNVVISPSGSPVVTIATATLDLNIGGVTATGTISGLEVYNNGVKIASATLSLGDLTLGPLSLVGVSATLTNLDTTGATPAGIVTVTATTISLNLGTAVNATVSNLSVSIDLADSSSFTVKFDFVATIASGALKITATNVVISPSGSPVVTIATATLDLNIGGVTATGTISGLEVYNNGVKIASATLNLGDLTLGPLSMVGVSATLTNLDTTGVTPAGIVTVTASTISLNLGSSVNATVSNLSVSIDLADSSSFTVKFDFVATIASGALKITATNVVISPSGSPVVTIATATLDLNIGGVTATGTISGLEVYNNGVKIASATLNLGDLTLGPLSLVGVSATLTNLDTTGATPAGIVTVTATTISLNLGSSVNATVSNLSVSIDLADSSSFTVKFDFVATIASGALKITATNVVISPSGSPVVTIATATLDLNIGGVTATGTISGLEVYNNGVKIASATLSLGDLTLGPLSLVGVSATLTNLDTTGATPAGIVTVTATTISLNLGTAVNATVSNLSVSIDLADSSSFTVKFDFVATIASGALKITATNVVISPSGSPVVTIATATLDLNIGGVTATGTISGLEVYNNGIKIASATLSLGDLTLGPLSLVGVSATLTNLDTTGATPAGIVTVTASTISLNLGTAVNATVSNLSVSIDLADSSSFTVKFDFVATIASGALKITATNVVISPSGSPVVTIATATLDLNIGGVTATGTISGLEVYNNGVKIASVTLSLGDLTLGPLSLVGVSATLTNLDTTGATPAGIVTVTATTISLNLGSSVNATVSNLSVSIDLADSSSFTVKFDFVATIASGALKITATNVVISPSGSPVVTIATATLDLNIGGVTATGTISGLEIYNNGVKIASATLSLGDLTLGPLSLVGVSATLTNLDTTGATPAGIVTVTATTISLNLGTAVNATVSNLSVSIDLADSSSFTVKFDFVATIASGALKITATNVVISPSGSPVVTIATATLDLNIGGVTATGTISGLEVYNNGVKIASATLSLGDLTLGPLSLVGVSATLTNLDTTGATPAGIVTVTATTISLNLGTAVNATVSNLSVSIDLADSSSFTVKFDFVATIASGALTITATNVVISPSGSPVVTIATATLDLNIGGVTATGTISGLEVYNNGVKIASATLSLGDLTLGPLSLVGVSATLTNLDTTGATPAGIVTVTASTISLNLGTAVNATVSNLSVSIDLADSSSFTVKFDFVATIASGALKITATNVVISPSGSPVVTIATATLDLNIGGVTATGTISGLEVYNNGVKIASATLSLGDLTLGPLSLVGVSATLTNLDTTGATPAGIVTVTATTISLNLGSSVNAIVSNLSVSIDLADSSSFTVKFDFVATIASGALTITATNVVISPSGSPVVTIATATLDLNIGGVTATGTISGLEVYNNGVKIASATLSLGDLTLGPLSLVGVSATLTNLDTTKASPTGIVTVTATTISLNLGAAVTATVSNLAISINLGNSSAFTVKFNFVASIAGGVLTVTATNVVIAPTGSPVVTIATATMDLNVGGVVASGTISGLEIYNNGIKIASATVSLPHLAIGPLSLNGVSASVTNLDTTTATPSGIITISATTIGLNLGAAVTATVSNLSIAIDLANSSDFTVKFDFVANIANGAISITATNVVITPNGSPVVTIASATLGLNIGGVTATGTISGLEIYNNGVKIATATISLGDLTLGPLSLVGVSATLTNLDTTTGTASGLVTISATTISLNLGAAVSATVSNLSISINIANSSNFVVKFDFVASIASGALTITATNVVISPSGSPVASIASATLNLNLGGVTATGTISGLQVFNNGVKIASAIVNLGNITLGPLSLVGVSASVTNLDTTTATPKGIITVSASSVSLNLGAAVTATVSNLAISINLANTSAFTIKFDFVASIASGVLTITATNVVITPSSNPVVTIASATLGLNIGGVTATGTITGLEVYNNGVKISSATLSLGDLTLGPLSLVGVSATLTNLDTTGTTPTGVVSITATTIGLNLGAAVTATVSNLSVSIDLADSSAFTIKFDFVASIASGALTITATNVVISPSSNPVVTIASATLGLNVGGVTATGTISGLKIYNNGVKIASATLSLGDMTLGPLSLVGVSASLTNLDTTGATPTGIVTISATTISLNLGAAVTATVSNLSVTIDLANSSAFTIKFDFVASIASGALTITATNVVISPSSNPVVTIASATLGLNVGGVTATGTITGLEIYNNGVKIASATLSLGDLTLGPLSLVGVSATLTNLDTTGATPTGIVTISATTISLNLGAAVTATVSNLSVTIDLANSSAFTIKFDFVASIASGALTITATNVVISPSSNPVVTIASATLGLNVGGVTATGTITGLEIYNNGVKIASATLSLGDLTLGPLSLVGVSATLTNLDTTGATPTGIVTISATTISLNLGAAVTATVSNLSVTIDLANSSAFTIKFDFVASIASGALTITATNVVISPSSNPVVTIASATLGLNVGGVTATGTITGLEIYNNGVKIASATLSLGDLTLGPLSLVGVSATLTNLDTTGATPTGIVTISATTISLNLGAAVTATVSNLSVTIDLANSSAFTIKFDFVASIASGALTITATNVVISPSSNPVVTIASATLGLNVGGVTATGTITGLEIYNNGVKIASATLSLGDLTLGPLSLVGVSATLTNLDTTGATPTGIVTISATTISLNLGAAVTATVSNLSVTIDLANSSAFTIKFDFVASIASGALTITATNVVISPSSNPVVTIPSATLGLNVGGVTATGTITGLEIYNNGVKIASATLSLGDLTLGPLSLVGVSATLTNLDTTGATPTGIVTISATTISLNLGAAVTATVSNLSVTIDLANSSAFTIKFDFVASIASGALTITATNVVISPSSNPVVTIASATLGLNVGGVTATGTITGLEIYNNGVKIASATLSLGDLTLGPLSLVGVSATLTNLDTTGATPTGIVTISATTISLNLGAAVTATVSNLSVTIDLANSSAFTIKFDFVASIASGALTITATNVVISPSSNPVVTIASATLGLNVGGVTATGTITGLEIYNNGVKIASATLSLGDLTLGPLSLVGVSATLSNLDTTGATPTGIVTISATTISLNLGAAVTATVSNLSVTIDLANSSAFTIKFDFVASIASGALTITATNVVISPSSNPVVTIATASIALNLGGFSATGSITGLQVFNNGIKIASASITLGNLTLGPVSLTGLTATVTNLDTTTATASGIVTVSATGIGVNLGAALTVTATNFSATIDLSNGSAFVLKLGTLNISIASGAVVLAATNVTIAPNATGNNPIASIGSATLTINLGGSVVSGSLTNLVVYDDGITLANATVTLPPVTLGPVSLTGVSAAVNNLNTRGGTTTGTITVSATSIGVNLGAALAVTATNFSATIDLSNSSAFVLSLGTLNISIASGAVVLNATNIVIAPNATGNNPIASIGSATLTLSLGGTTVSGSLTNLVVYSDGITLANATVTLPPVTLGPLSLTGLSAAVNNLNTRGGTTTGTVTVSATSIGVNLGAALTVTATGFSATINISNASAFTLKLATLHIGIASNFVEIDATNIFIDPSATGLNPIASIGTASLKLKLSATDVISGSLTGLVVYDNGITLNSVTITLPTLSLGSIVTLTGASVTLSSLDTRTGTINGTITVAATSIAINLGSLASVVVSNFSASINLANPSDLKIHADLSISILSGTLTITALGVDITPSASVILQIASIAVKIPAFDAVNAIATATGLEITSSGVISVVTITVNVAGISKALGLGSYLPVNLTALQFKFLGDTNHNGLRDSGEVFKLTEFDLIFVGYIDFSKFGNLPFQPIVRIGSEPFVDANSNGKHDSGESYTDVNHNGSYDGVAIENGANYQANTFSFTIRIVNGVIKPWDIGPIELGIADWTIGNTLTIGGSIILGGYSNGEFVPTFGGRLKVAARNNMNTLSGSLEVTLIGSFVGGVLNVTATFTLSFKFYSYVEVQNASITVTFKSRLTGGITFEDFTVLSGSVQLVRLQVGSFLVLQATNATFNFRATGSEYLVTFGSLSASLPSLGITGSAFNFAISADGDITGLPGFGVELSLSASGSLKWPSWLPIQITKLGLFWQDPADLANFQIKLSASVVGIQGLPVQVEGVVEDVVFDVGLLFEGKFPIIDIGAVGISISGKMFGGEVSGQIILGIVKVDVNDKIVGVDTGADPTNIKERVFYAAVGGTIEIPGLGGLGIRFALSSKGPLQIFIYADIPILIEPNTGLTLAGFNAGVRFNDSLPTINDPLELRGPAFQSPNELTLAQWQQQIKRQVVNQIRSGADSWNIFASPMIIEGGAEMYSAYISKLTFRASIRIAISTDGKILINAEATFFNFLTLDMKLYMDLSQLTSGSFKIFFLADFPKAFPLITLRGSLTMEFTTGGAPYAPAIDPQSGKPIVDPETGAAVGGQADSFVIKIQGGVDVGPQSFNLGITMEGEATLFFESWDQDNNPVTPPVFRAGLDISGALTVKYLVGQLNLLEAQGQFRFERNTAGGEPATDSVEVIEVPYTLDYGTYTSKVVDVSYNDNGTPGNTADDFYSDANGNIFAIADVFVLNDNGTPGDHSDDVALATLKIQAFQRRTIPVAYFGSTSVTFSDNGTPNDPTDDYWYNAQTITNGVDSYDALNGIYTRSMVVSIDDNGTPNDPSDDTYMLPIWRDSLTGNFYTKREVTIANDNGTPKDFSDDTGVTAKEYVTESVSVIWNDNATPGDTSDDYYADAQGNRYSLADVTITNDGGTPTVYTDDTSTAIRRVQVSILDNGTPNDASDDYYNLPGGGTAAVDDSYVLYGALAIKPAQLGFLNDLGLHYDGAVIFRINTGANDRNLALDFEDPNVPDVVYTLYANSMSFLMFGDLRLDIGGTTWFKIHGTVYMEIFTVGDSDGLFGFKDLPSGMGWRFFINGYMTIGPSEDPYLTIGALGFFQVKVTFDKPTGTGIAGMIRLGIDTGTGVNESLGFELSGMFTLMFNTSREAVDFEIPSLSPDPVSASDQPAGFPNSTITPSQAITSASVDIPAGAPSISPRQAVKQATNGTGFVEGVDTEAAGNYIFVAVTGSDLNDGMSFATMNFVDSSGNVIFALDGSFSMVQSDSFTADLGSLDVSISSIFRLQFYASTKIGWGGTDLFSFQAFGAMYMFYTIKVNPLTFEVSVDAGMAGIVSLTLDSGFRNDHGTPDTSDDTYDLPFGMRLGLNLEFFLQFNITNKEITFYDLSPTLPSVTIEPLSVSILFNANLTIGVGSTGFTLEGNFKLEIKFSGATKYVLLTAHALIDLEIAGVHILKFNADGGLYIGQDGLAAALDLSLNAGVPSNLGFSLDMTFQLQINTLGTVVHFDTNNDGDTNDPTDLTVAAGSGGTPYVRIFAQGILHILVFDLNGTLLIQFNGSSLILAVSLNLQIKVASVTLFDLHLSGGMKITNEGLVAFLSFDLGSGFSIDPSLKFGLTATFYFEVNTTSSAVALSEFGVGTIVSPDGVSGHNKTEIAPGVRVFAYGRLDFFGIYASGMLYFEKFGSTVIIYAAATLYLKIGSVDLLQFQFTGFILITNRGFAASITLQLSLDMPAGFLFNFSLDTTFRLDMNFTGQELVFGDIVIPGGVGVDDYVRIYIQGTLQGGIANGAVASFRLSGTLILTINFNPTTHVLNGFTFDLNVTAHISLASGAFVFDAAVVAVMGIDSDGLYLGLLLSINNIDLLNFLHIQGSIFFFINTRDTALDMATLPGISQATKNLILAAIPGLTIAPNSLKFGIVNAEVSFKGGAYLGLKATGSIIVTFDFTNVGFRIDIPQSNPLKIKLGLGDVAANFGLDAEISIYGYINTIGGFSFNVTGALSLNLSLLGVLNFTCAFEVSIYLNDTLYHGGASGVRLHVSGSASLNLGFCTLAGSLSGDFDTTGGFSISGYMSVDINFGLAAAGVNVNASIWTHWNSDANGLPTSIKDAGFSFGFGGYARIGFTIDFGWFGSICVCAGITLSGTLAFHYGSDYGGGAWGSGSLSFQIKGCVSIMGYDLCASWDVGFSWGSSAPTSTQNDPQPPPNGVKALLAATLGPVDETASAGTSSIGTITAQTFGTPSGTYDWQEYDVPNIPGIGTTTHNEYVTLNSSNTAGLTNTVKLQSGAAIDYETLPSDGGGHYFYIAVQVRSHDQYAAIGATEDKLGGDPDGGDGIPDRDQLWSAQLYKVYVNDIGPSPNSANTGDSNAATNQVTEGASQGTAVGITADFIEPLTGNGPIVYSLSNSAGSRFQIDSATGVVSVGSSAGSIDYESATSHSITVLATQTNTGKSASQSYTITVNNASPGSSTDNNGSNNTVDGTATGSTVGITAHATDPNGGAITYSLPSGVTSNNSFSINSSSGVVSLGSSAIGAGSYTITVRAADPSGLYSSTTFTVAVTVT